MYNNNRSRILQ